MLAVTNITYAQPQYYLDEDSGFYFNIFGTNRCIIGYDWSSDKSFNELTGNLVFPLSVYGNSGGWIAAEKPIDGIYSYAFRDCEQIRSITFPDRYLTALYNDSFTGCKNLETVNNLKVYYLGKGAFSYCDNLFQITLPSGLKTIDDWCFDSCKKLKNITIPSTVTSIGNGVFQRCPSLESVEILSCDIPELKDVTFWGCSNLKKITLCEDGSNELRAIGKRCFDGCNRLESIFIPWLVAEIGSEAFKGCISLERIHIDGHFDKVIDISEDTFSQETYDNALLIVFNYDKYLNHDVWKKFKHISSQYDAGKEASMIREINFLSEDVSLEVDESKELQVSLTPACVDHKYLKWYSSDPNIVHVDDNGIIKGISFGTATITVRDSRYHYAEASISVSVINEPGLNGIEDVISDFNENDSFEIYNLTGVKVNNSLDGLSHGIYFVRQGAKFKKIVVN